MADISIRDLDGAAAVKLSEMARNKHMSREAYIRQQLEVLAVAGEIKEIENKYETLVNRILDVIKINTEVLERVSERIWNDE